MTRMVGRTAELESLIRALERARDGRGSVALVGGEAGIGKTTLLRELQGAADARGILTLWGRTPEAVWAGPYAPWVDALDGFEGRSAAIFAVDETLAPDDRQTRIHDRVLGELGATVARKPALLVLEDLHWADPLSLELISRLMEAFAHAPLFLICVYRPETEHRSWHLGTIASRKCPERYTELFLRELTPAQATAWSTCC